MMLRVVGCPPNVARHFVAFRRQLAIGNEGKNDKKYCFNKTNVIFLKGERCLDLTRLQIYLFYYFPIKKVLVSNTVDDYFGSCDVTFNLQLWSCWMTLNSQMKVRWFKPPPMKNSRSFTARLIANVYLVGFSQTHVFIGTLGQRQLQEGI